MSKYHQYNDYLPADIWHLSRKPAHWNTAQLKRVVDGCVNGIWGAEPDGKDDMVVVRVADFDRDRLSIKDSGYTFRKVSKAERLRRQLNRGDLLLEKSGGGEKTLVGQVVLFDGGFDAVTSNFVAKMSPKPTHDSKFLNYVFARFYNERINYCSIKQNTGIQNLDSDQYLSEHFVFPCLIEQRKIAAFLDHETAKIDTLIEKQHQLIELMKEKRQAVISHAVTKGLNPDVPMKDSDLEWLGEVPEHWTVKRLKHISSKIGVGLVINPSHYVQDEGVHFLFGGDILEYGFKLKKTRKMSDSNSRKLSQSRLEENDLVCVRVGYPGVTAVIPKELEGSNCASMMVIRRGDFDSQWLSYCLNSNLGKNQVERIQYGAAQKQYNIADAIEFRFPVPPKDEQVEISSYLDAQRKKFNSLIRHAERAIKLLLERRTALISAAVAGKIDVRNWKPQSAADMQQKTTVEPVATPVAP